jgi:hypothetical protein
MATKKTESRIEPDFEIANITVDKALQPRVTLNSEVIADYRDAYVDGIELPPIDLIQNGETYWLVDGFHRLSAAQKLGFETIAAQVTKGNREAAIRAAIRANIAHGLRRSSADKRRAVQMAFGLMTETKANWTDTTIAEMAGVSSMMVGNVRKELYPETKEKTERTTPSGRTVNVENLGKRPVAKVIEADDMDAPEPSGLKPVDTGKSKTGPLGVAMDRLLNRQNAMELVITELRSIFPNDYNLGEAIGAIPALATTFGKLRSRVEKMMAELNGIALPFEVGEDATGVAIPIKESAPEPKAKRGSRKTEPKAEAQAETPEGVSIEVPLGKLNLTSGELTPA